MHLNKSKSELNPSDINKMDTINSENEVVIRLSTVSKKYNLYNKRTDRVKEALNPFRKSYHADFYALKNINLKINKGEILGIIGRNGSGKSTLLKIISGIIMPTSGNVEVKKKVAALLELSSGFNPEFTGRENIYFMGSLHEFSREEMNSKVDEIIEFAEIGEHIDQPLKTYSTGMRARLAFAVNTAIEPEILILDEVLSVGDELFKRKAFVAMNELIKNEETTVLFVSHSMQNVMDLCNRSILLHQGEILLEGNSELVVSNYWKLLSSGDPLIQAEIIKELRSLNSNTDEKKKREAALNNRNISNRICEDYELVQNVEDDFWVEGFESKAKRVVKKKNVDIVDYKLETIDGRKVNHLLWGNEYRISYRAVFNEKVEHVRIGCIIHDDKSKDITGFLYPERVKPISTLSAGEEYLFSTTFKAYLQAGLYGIRLIARGNDNGTIGPVSSVFDALVFRIIERPHKYSEGIVDLFK